MSISENGRWNEELKCFEWWETLYYDDISHKEYVHNAYMLRFFEHAREHMLDEKYLADVIENEEKMFVAVSTYQKQLYNIEIKNKTRVGNWLNVRTTVQVDGKFRIRFCHNLYLSDSINKETELNLLCEGYVDMVCVNPINHKITTLPDSIFKQVSNIENIPKMKIKSKTLQSLNQPKSTYQTYNWIVSDFDTDFTKVVYQAKYLQYYECCLMRNLQELSLVIKDDNIVQLIVTEASLNFLKPALPNDNLLIKIVKVEKDGKFKLILNLEASLNNNIINKAVIHIALINTEKNRLVPIFNSDQQMN